MAQKLLHWIWDAECGYGSGMELHHCKCAGELQNAWNGIGQGERGLKHRGDQLLLSGPPHPSNLVGSNPNPPYCQLLLAACVSREFMAKPISALVPRQVTSLAHITDHCDQFSCCLLVTRMRMPICPQVSLLQHSHPPLLGQPQSQPGQWIVSRDHNGFDAHLATVQMRSLIPGMITSEQCNHAHKYYDSSLRPMVFTFGNDLLN